MGKVYIDNLKVTPEIEEKLIQYSSVYKVLYNKVLFIQMQNRDSAQTIEAQFMPLENITKRVEEENIEFPFKFDEGIKEAAMIHGYRAFYSWWRGYLESPPKASRHSTPNFIRNDKDSFFFFTSSNMKFDKNGVYVPKIGYIKLAGKIDIPYGEYKEVRISLVGSKWTIRFEAIKETPIKVIEPLIDTLEVKIYSDGSLQIGDIEEIPSILENETFLEDFDEIIHYEKTYHKKRTNKNLSYTEKQKSKNKLIFLRNKLKYNLTKHFNTVANKVIKAQPAKVMISADKTINGNLQAFKTGNYRKARTIYLVRAIKKKADLNGIKVLLKGIDPSIFQDKKDFIKF